MAVCPSCNGYVRGDVPWCGQCFARITLAATSNPAVATSAPAPEYAFAAADATAIEHAGGPPPAPETVVRPPGWRPAADVAAPVAAKASTPHGNIAGLATIAAITAIAAGALYQGLIKHIATGGHTSTNDLINDDFTLQALLYIVVGVGLVIFVRATGTRLRWHEGDPLTSIGMGALRGAIVAGVVTAIAYGAEGHLVGDTRFTDLLSENNGLRIFLTIIVGVGAAPLVEETLFRGVLLESWRTHVVWAIIISAIAFSAWHLNGTAAIYYAVLGVAMGRVYLKRGLIGSMCTHATFNAIVIGVTIASISGGAHTFTADELHIRTPASWHEETHSTDGGAAGFGLGGPSGSAFVVLQVLDHASPYTTSELPDVVSRDMTALIASRDLTAAPETVELPLGPAERIQETTENHTLEIYVAATLRHTYVFATDSAGSKTAKGQLPAIVNGLGEQ
jgi:membrane protease YdiL (CAAX protease family)